MQKLKNMKRTLKNQAGITLVELLAVLVILGIVAAIAVPAIGNIIENAEEDAVKADAISLLEAARLAEASGNINGTTLNQTHLEEFIDIKTEWGTSVTVSIEEGVPYLTADYEVDGKTYSFVGASIDDINDNDFNDSRVLTGKGSAGGGGGA